MVKPVMVKYKNKSDIVMEQLLKWESLTDLLIYIFSYF